MAGVDQKISGYAGEMLSAMQVLSFVMDRIIRPSGALAEHVRWFDLASRIMDLLLLGDQCVLHCDELQELERQHHEVFMELFPDCAKPKLHYSRHIAECVRRFQVNLNCFSTERRHRASKSVAAFCYNRMSRSLTATAANAFLRHAQEPRNFQAIRLNGKAMRVTKLLQGFAGMLGSNCTLVGSSSVRSPRGTFSKDDMVLWRGVGGVRAGRAQFYFSCTKGASVRYLACVGELQPAAPGLWAAEGAVLTLVAVEHLLVAAPYQYESGRHLVRVRVPSTLPQ